MSVIRSLVTLLLVHILSAQATTSTTGKHFNVIRGVRITSKIYGFAPSKSPSLVRCAASCIQEFGCQGVNFDILTGACELLGTTLQDPDGHLYEIYYSWTLAQINDIQYEWKLAFKFSIDLETNLWYAWEYGTGNQSHLPWICFSTRIGCDHVIRTNILDYWQNVEMVEVAFFTDGRKVAFIRFYAGGVYYRNDFLNTAAIVSSSFTDLENFQFQGLFSPYTRVEGVEEEGLRFLVAEYDNSTSLNCPMSGWMMVVDSTLPGQGGACPYTQSMSRFPKFIYSPTGSKGSFNDAIEAEVFAVYVKFSTPVTPSSLVSTTHEG